MASAETSTATGQRAGKEMDLVVREQVPICITLCEPICATSDYQVTVALLGIPFATVGLKGLTRFAKCDT